MANTCDSCVKNVTDNIITMKKDHAFEPYSKIYYYKTFYPTDALASIEECLGGVFKGSKSDDIGYYFTTYLKRMGTIKCYFTVKLIIVSDLDYLIEISCGKDHEIRWRDFAMKRIISNIPKKRMVDVTPKKYPRHKNHGQGYIFDATESEYKLILLDTGKLE